jgi:beta-glucosidase
VSFPRRLADSPAHKSALSFPGDGTRVHYEEGVFVGYRHFDSNGVDPLFPFGHGLSYTRFEYTAMELSRPVFSAGDTVHASVTVRNVGDRAGAEVVQIYVRDESSSVPRPEKELKGFQKLFLAPGESAVARFELGARDFSYYCEQALRWRAEPGFFEILAASSSRDIRLSQRIELSD